MKTFDDDLVLTEYTTFEESIKVNGDIRGEDGKRYSLTVHGYIDAGNIYAGNIDAGNIDAGHIDAGHIDAGHIDAGNIDAGHIDAGHIDAWTIDAWNIYALDIDSRNIYALDIDARGDLRYYAFCTAYKNIRYGGVLEAKRDPAAGPIALDGTVEQKTPEQHSCPDCGTVHEVNGDTR